MILSIGLKHYSKNTEICPFTVTICAWLYMLGFCVKSDTMRYDAGKMYIYMRYEPMPTYDTTLWIRCIFSRRCR